MFLRVLSHEDHLQTMQLRDYHCANVEIGCGDGADKGSIGSNVDQQHCLSFYAAKLIMRILWPLVRGARYAALGKQKTFRSASIEIWNNDQLLPRDT